MVFDRAPEHELLLLLAGTQARRRRHADRIRELACGTGRERMTAAMTRQRMLPLLGSRLLECASDALSEALVRDLQAAIAVSIRQGAVQEMAMLYVIGLLEREGLRILPVKGQSLSRIVHGAPGLRSSTDIDLLVSTQDLQNAVAVLRERGFVAVEDPRERNGLPLLHVALQPPPGTELPAVELHWRLHWYEDTFSGRMLEHSRIDGSGTRRAQPRDELASLLLFYARDGFLGLRSAADVAAWWDRCDQPGRAGLVRGVMEEHPALVPALRAAATLVHELVGAGPSDLAGFPPPLRRERLAVRLANWSGRGDRDQVAANVALIDALLAPPGTSREFARRQLFAATEQRTVATHATKTVARFGPALWSVRRGRTYAAWPTPPSTEPFSRGV